MQYEMQNISQQCFKEIINRTELNSEENLPQNSTEIPPRYNFAQPPILCKIIDW